MNKAIFAVFCATALVVTIAAVAATRATDEFRWKYESGTGYYSGVLMDSQETCLARMDNAISSKSLESWKLSEYRDRTSYTVTYSSGDEYPVGSPEYKYIVTCCASWYYEKMYTRIRQGEVNPET